MFLSHCLKKLHNFRGKLYWILRVVWIYLQILSKTCHSKTFPLTVAEYHTPLQGMHNLLCKCLPHIATAFNVFGFQILSCMYISLHVKGPLFWSYFDENYLFSGIVSKNTRLPNFIKIRPFWFELFHADGWTDRHDEANSRFWKFGECAYKQTSLKSGILQYPNVTFNVFLMCANIRDMRNFHLRNFAALYWSSFSLSTWSYSECTVSSVSSGRKGIYDIPF
jgi:hypothetical protein